MIRVLAAAAACFLSCAIAPAETRHPDSLSSSYLVVRDREITHDLRLQVLSIEEVIPGFDAGDLAGHRDALHAYVARHYRVIDRAGTKLEPRLVSLARAAGSSDDLDPFSRFEWIHMRLAYTSALPVEELTIEVDLFRDTSPDHRDLCTIEGEDGDTQVFVLSPEALSIRWPDEDAGAALPFFRLGWEHIVTGWDHLAFLAALLLATARLRGLLAVITTFTIAHSITLAVVALDVWQPRGIARYVEAAIALSIAYVAVDNLLQRGRLRTRWIEAFLFGLIHGLGFAGFLRESLMVADSRPAALFYFNLGVEAGQILIVAAAALLLRLLPRPAEESGPAALAPRGLRIGGSVVLASTGFWLFLQRV